MELYVGIDLGTSGCRTIAIDGSGHIHGASALAFPVPIRRGAEVEQDPAIWWRAVVAALHRLIAALPADHYVAAIAVDGTSGTLLLADADGRPLGPALMYSDSRSRSQAELIAGRAPPESGAHGPASGLAKLLWLKEHSDTGDARHALHQADWIAGRLRGSFGHSDYNNALKLGYDVERRGWPGWLHQLPLNGDLLPAVVAPGTRLGALAGDVAAELGLPADTSVVAGTTDSVAAFRATGAATTGAAVTSLGSTLVLKVLADEPVFAPEFGVYSHRYDDHWLVGGASNAGGTVLKQYFDDEQITALSERIRPAESTGLDYYPLPAPGERFPVADPELAPRLTPRPPDDAIFFQGILEGIADIEKKGYELLRRLGAPFPASLRTVGGGAANRRWTAMRQRLLGIPFVEPVCDEAVYGAALLAQRGMEAAHGRSA